MTPPAIRGQQWQAPAAVGQGGWVPIVLWQSQAVYLAATAAQAAVTEGQGGSLGRWKGAGLLHRGQAGQVAAVPVVVVAEG